MTKAALYARVSTDAQQKEGTIESQVAELKRQIAAAGHLLVREYIDDGYSGTLLDRPALEHLRRDVKTDQFDAIYFLGKSAQHGQRQLVLRIADVVLGVDDDLLAMLQEFVDDDGLIRHLAGRSRAC